ncbi:uncharacterized protein LOC144721140 [Lampetra planeri]
MAILAMEIYLLRCCCCCCCCHVQTAQRGAARDRTDRLHRNGSSRRRNTSRWRKAQKSQRISRNWGKQLLQASVGVVGLKFMGDDSDRPPYCASYHTSPSPPDTTRRSSSTDARTKARRLRRLSMRANVLR